ncbi:hypothetical protein PHYBLDRAFT_73370 [Phycomyces blakesleeanus NRRL 1555(-)]|uniref:Uncharacterized protein n=1 Tax=Phycomyces blakesleeanus (strain ATCC 8743b / DSM 1359 / FGSC 10004 / NBRC 33097 / NRRL 1555) TaxID=763407 RepID=A0A163DP42_PHYB8|nr:hypothetical protein PHYBLDRAFT_73370 [Phycomyces blakesleeanus NRRL 1555(-)]OAD72640.1 hypothetical protein PHYBLDRAFT_73370 [Phycomyces blakesleeanus NRRL 1555(-)]|eukprot:XP_018290680.1 hypothetical protein PHYBLDRAFT_73370 [Phycomyces blakesleeanus NRRL 1555(-)]
MVFIYSLLRKYRGTKFPQPQTELLDEANEAFVNHTHYLMLTLNVNWVNLFEGRTYAGGALYLLISNFFRENQMKAENIILFGVMPGPKEAENNQMGNFLENLVDELVELYGGITAKATEFPSGTAVHTAIMRVTSNIPAARNAAGFT